MIAAPLEIAGQRYICSIIVKESQCLDDKGNPTNQIRLNITDACLLNEINQLCSSGSGPVSAELKKAASTTLAGYCAKLIISFITYKSSNLNNPKSHQEDKEDKHKDENHTQYICMKNNKALYESIMKDIAKFVKCRLLEYEV